MTFFDNWKLYSHLRSSHGNVCPGTPITVVSPMLDIIEDDFWYNKEKAWLPFPTNGILAYELINRLFDRCEIDEPLDRIKFILQEKIHISEPGKVEYLVTKSIIEETFRKKFNKPLDFPINLFNEDPNELLKEKNMNFDYGIANPPYQMRTTKNGPQATDIYPDFVELLHKHCKKVVAITPSRWFDKGGKMSEYRKKMLEEYGLTEIYHSDDNHLFGSDVDIKGGVSFFKLDPENSTTDQLFEVVDFNRNTGEKTTLYSYRGNLGINDGRILVCRSEKTESIILKTKSDKKVSRLFKSKSSFGINTNEDNKWCDIQEGNSLCLVSRAKAADRKKYVEKHLVSSHKDYLKWKVALRAADGKGRDTTDFCYLLKPEEVCNSSYVYFPFDTRAEAESFISYFHTKLFKFLFSVAKMKQDITGKVFRYIPEVAFSSVWTDEELYKKFNLTEKEINHIESCLG